MKAKQICDEFNLNSQKGLVYHNIGSLYGIMANSEEAIYYYKKSLEYKNDEKSKLISLLCVVMEYSKIT